VQWVPYRRGRNVGSVAGGQWNLSRNRSELEATSIDVHRILKLFDEYDGVKFRVSDGFGSSVDLDFASEGFIEAAGKLRLNPVSPK
jgi:hypothetical protein